MVARLGASSTAHAVAPLAAEARDVRPPPLAVHDCPPVAGAEPRACDPLRAGVHGSGPGDVATTTRRAGVTLATTARPPAAAVATSAHHRDPRVHPRLHVAAGAGEGHGMRTLRRRRVPWTGLGRERLAAAWERVLTEHGAGGELMLVGIFGPVAIDAVASVALEPDGRLAMTFARRGVAGRPGDVALARHVASGRLVRSDIAHPARGRIGRNLR